MKPPCFALIGEAAMARGASQGIKVLVVLSGVFSILFGLFGCTAPTPPPEALRPPSSQVPPPRMAPPSGPPSTVQVPPEPSQAPAVAPPLTEAPPQAPAAPKTPAVPPPAAKKPPRPTPPPRKAVSSPLILSAAPTLILIPETQELFFALVPDRDLDLFFSKAKMRYYYYHKGRWYSTRYYRGPWRPVDPQELPEDLKKASPIELKSRILPILLLKRPGG